MQWGRHGEPSTSWRSRLLRHDHCLSRVPFRVRAELFTRSAFVEIACLLCTGFFFSMYHDA